MSIEPFHLFRYLDGLAFRFNNREATDSERFRKLCDTLFGRRVAYAQVTGG